MSQALIGQRIGRWRETVNRAVRHLVALGYFRTSWVTVQRSTAQGVKGVTRVMHELGPVLAKLVENRSSKPGNPAGQPRGVTLSHPSPTPPGSPGTVGDSVVAKSADRRGGPSDSSSFKRKTLEQWPRLAGSRPQPTPTPPRFADLAELERAAIALGAELQLDVEPSELSADEYEARIAQARRRGAPGQRHQPRRLPRSRR